MVASAHRDRHADRVRLCRAAAVRRRKSSRTPAQQKIDSQTSLRIYRARGEAERKGVPPGDTGVRIDARGGCWSMSRAPVTARLQASHPPPRRRRAVDVAGAPVDHRPHSAAENRSARRRSRGAIHRAGGRRRQPSLHPSEVTDVISPVAVLALPSRSAPRPSGPAPASRRSSRPRPRSLPVALAQIDALIAEKDSRDAAQQKIDSQLLYAQRMDAGQPIADGTLGDRNRRAIRRRRPCDRRAWTARAGSAADGADARRRNRRPASSSADELDPRARRSRRRSSRSPPTRRGVHPAAAGRVDLASRPCRTWSRRPDRAAAARKAT